MLEASGRAAAGGQLAVRKADASTFATGILALASSSNGLRRGESVLSCWSRGVLASAAATNGVVTPSAIEVSCAREYAGKRFDDAIERKDVEALKAELSDPRFADGWWQEQIQMMLSLDKKAEQQSLAKYGLDFVTDTYLPEKLAEIGLGN